MGAEIVKSKIHKVYDLINNRKNAMANALPKHVTPDRLINIITNVVRVSPKLADCSSESLIGAVMMSTYTGLEPSVLGHCYFVPFKGQVQFIIGYRGLLQLVNNSGQVSFVNAECVYSNEVFQQERGLNPKLVHIPITDGERGDLKEVYAVVNFKDGSKDFLVMGKEDIQKIKNASPSKNSNESPWKKWEPEMWKKSVLKRFAKMLPLSIENQRLIAQDEAVKSYDASYENILSQPDEVEYSNVNEYKQEPPTLKTDIEKEPEPVIDAEVIEPETVPEKKPEKKKEMSNGNLFQQPKEGTYAERLENIMVTEFSGDPQGWKKFLKEHSGFTNSEDKYIYGKEKISDLSLPRQKATYIIISNFLKGK